MGLARQWGWPGTRAEDGLITVDPERAKSAARRYVQVGGRRFGVTGCAGDIFFYAPLARPSLQLEDTCPVTGTPIRVVFTPSGVERAEPAGAVWPLPGLQSPLASSVKRAVEAAGDIGDIDAKGCVQCAPLFASTEAAQGWLDANPDGRVLPFRQAWDLRFHREWRDRMSVLLNLKTEHRPGGRRGDEPHTIDPQPLIRSDRVSDIEHDNDAGLAGFMAEWDKRLQKNEQLPVGIAILVLTNFGERPVPSARLAEVLGLSVREAEAQAQGHCTTATPAEDGLAQVEDGLITYINPERAKSAPRRHLQIGDSRFGVSGCADDVFLYAPLVRPSLQVEETCPATGTPIRIAFTPSGVESVDPGGAVLPYLPPQEFDRLEGMTVKDVDATVCAQVPFYSSAEAAQGWLAAHPGGRIFPVRQAWDLSFHRIWRARMSALLNLGN